MAFKKGDVVILTQQNRSWGSVGDWGTVAEANVGIGGKSVILQFTKYTGNVGGTHCEYKHLGGTCWYVPEERLKIYHHKTSHQCQLECKNDLSACGEKDENENLCTRLKGHSGPHVSCNVVIGSDFFNEDKHDISVWENKKEKCVADCMHKNPCGALSPDDFSCTRRKGHSGSHHACSPRKHDYAVWSEKKAPEPTPKPIPDLYWSVHHIPSDTYHQNNFEAPTLTAAIEFVKDNGDEWDIYDVREMLCYRCPEGKRLNAFPGYKKADTQREKLKGPIQKTSKAIPKPQPVVFRERNLRRDLLLG